jgi:hypothetical protein
LCNDVFIFSQNSPDAGENTPLRSDFTRIESSEKDDSRITSTSFDFDDLQALKLRALLRRLLEVA